MRTTDASVAAFEASGNAPTWEKTALSWAAGLGPLPQLALLAISVLPENTVICGSASIPITPNSARVGPTPRMSTVFGLLPPIQIRR